MKTLIITFGILVFVVPAVVAVFLISTFIAMRDPDLYFSFIALALALFILAMASGLSGLEPFSIGSVGSFPRTQQRPNSIQEITHEKSFEGQVRL